MKSIEIADAAARLEDLIDLVVSGETIDIMRDGQAAARLVAAHPQRKPIDIAALNALTDKMVWQDQGAGDFIRWMRDTDRY